MTTRLPFARLCERSRDALPTNSCDSRPFDILATFEFDLEILAHSAFCGFAWQSRGHDKGPIGSQADTGNDEVVQIIRVPSIPTSGGKGPWTLGSSPNVDGSIVISVQHDMIKLYPQSLLQVQSDAIQYWRKGEVHRDFRARVFELGAGCGRVGCYGARLRECPTVELKHWLI